MHEPDEASPRAASPDDQDAAHALGAVLELQAAQQAREAGAQAARRESNHLQIATVCLLAALALYPPLMKPRWLRPAPYPAESAQHREAGVRFAVFLESRRIESFRLSHHRLPASLKEAGVAVPGLRYVAVDSVRFRLAAPLGGGAVEFDSALPDREFLGNSERWLAPARRAAP